MIVNVYNNLYPYKMSDNETDTIPHKFTSEEIKQRRIASRQRMIEECARYERQCIILEKKIVEIEGWIVLDKMSAKQKHHQLYKVEYQLSEIKTKYNRLQQALYTA